MASKHESQYENFDLTDAAWSSSSVTIGPATVGGTNWSVPICSTCQSSPCICNAVSTVQGVITNVTLEDPLQRLLERLSICQVCGAEDSFVLCSVCVEAVKLARNRWLDDFRREIDALAD